MIAYGFFGPQHHEMLVLNIDFSATRLAFGFELCRQIANRETITGLQLWIGPGDVRLDWLRWVL